MKTIKTITLGLLACGLMATGASAQGFLGERTFGVDGGWERLENGSSDDGWGAGAELNLPAPVEQGATVGADLNLRFDYMDVFDLDMMRGEGIIRGYLPAGEMGVIPFLGAGFGWVDFDVTDSTYVPVEGGVEFAMGRASIAPFYRYIFALDSDVDDYWAAGVKAVAWVNEVWGLTASFAYTDYDDIEGLGGFEDGLGARVGLIFSF